MAIDLGWAELMSREAYRSAVLGLWRVIDEIWIIKIILLGTKRSSFLRQE